MQNSPAYFKKDAHVRDIAIRVGYKLQLSAHKIAIAYFNRYFYKEGGTAAETPYLYVSIVCIHSYIHQPPYLQQH
jgi:hypothetical protein